MEVMILYLKIMYEKNNIPIRNLYKIHYKEKELRENIKKVEC